MAEFVEPKRSANLDFPRGTEFITGWSASPPGDNALPAITVVLIGEVDATISLGRYSSVSVRAGALPTVSH